MNKVDTHGYAICPERACELGTIVIGLYRYTMGVRLKNDFGCEER